MVKFKKRLSSTLALVFVVFTCLGYVPVKATEATTKVTFVGVEHSPLVVGDTETFYISSIGAEKVQYRVFQNKIGTDKWEELTQGYTTTVNANEISSINGLTKYEAGKYKLSVWVKKADEEGKFKNKNGDYDSCYVTYLNCVNKDNNNRVYTNGNMNIEKDSYVVGETVKVDGIKDISGMKAPYTYKLHIYDVNNNAWTIDKANYRDKESLTWVADKAGTYVLDAWAMSSNSTLWKNEVKSNGRIYESWKLKVITVKEKAPETDITIAKNGEIYGSEDATKPMEISKKVNITASDVVLNNVNIKGNVTITGDNAILNNVKVEGTLVVNPGENGTVNLNGVNADTIKVLSGGSNSIHFNNVNAKTLNISSDSLVRVESKGTTKIGNTTVQTHAIIDSVSGSFGEITVSIINRGDTKIEQVVELRGTFTEAIIMKTAATLKAAANAKISKIVIEPSNNEKITLDGAFGEVVVNKAATVATTSNTKIVKVTTNSPATLELAAGSKVTTLDEKGQTVTKTGTGTIETKTNPTTPVTPPSTGGGSGGGSGSGSGSGSEIVNPPVVTPTKIDNILKSIVNIANKQPGFKEALDIQYNKQTSILNVNVTNSSMTLGELFALKNSRLPLSGEDKKFLASLYGLDVKINNKSVNSITEKILDTKFVGKSLKAVLNELTYTDLIMLINNSQEFKDDQMTISIDNDSLTSITINGTIYGGNDKHISRQELRDAFGIKGNLSDATLNNFKDKTIVITIGTTDCKIVINK